MAGHEIQQVNAETTTTDTSRILVLDAGGTGIRGIVFDKSGHIVDREFEATPALHPEAGATEYDPEELWNALKSVLSRTVHKQPQGTDMIKAIGITTQRASFCLWEKSTGKPLTNIISWQDVRAADVADEMNRNIVWRALRKAAAVVSFFTRSPLLTATSMLRITTDHDTCRVRWILKQRPELRERCESGEVVFGTVDTWFIYKLTGGRSHVTDYTNATATGLFNPFALKWNGLFCRVFHIPMKILPEVVDTNGYFGTTDANEAGAAIPIRAAVGDQQAALFGHCCFEKGEVKISQGSGAFVDINVGPKEKLSRRGLFPMVAWVLDGQPTYMLEGYVATAGTLIDWLGMGMGFSNTPKALNEFAAECEDSEGVIFIPTPSGIRFPYFNPRMKATILGLTLSTHRRHLARAVLEGIALRIVDILDGIHSDARVPVRSMRVDGGVSRSDVLMQCLADYADIDVYRSHDTEMTSRGAAFLAGLAAGFWESQEELRSLSVEYRQFTPSIHESFRTAKIRRWRKAVNAVMSIE